MGEKNYFLIEKIDAGAKEPKIVIEYMDFERWGGVGPLAKLGVVPTTPERFGSWAREITPNLAQKQ